MQIIDRYILKEYIKALVYCVLAFILLYIIGDLFNYIDEMLRYQVPLEIILIYYGTSIPIIFVQVAPMAALLATIYTLSNFRKHNEIMAMRISGVSVWKILMPILFSSALLSLSVFIVNERLVPEFAPISSRIRDERIREQPKDDEKANVIEDVAIFGEDNRIIYARFFNTKTNEARDIIIHQNDDKQNLIMKITAQSGRWKDGKWTFENGTSYRLDEAGYIIGTPSPFEKKVMDLKEGPHDFARVEMQPEFMNFRRLKLYIDRFSVGRSSTTSKKLLVELFYKTSFPLLSLVVIFVGAPTAFMLHKGGLLVGIAVSIFIGLIFYGVQAFFLALGKGGLLPPLIAAWLPNILSVAGGIILVRKCR